MRDNVEPTRNRWLEDADDAAETKTENFRL